MVTSIKSLNKNPECQAYIHGPRLKFVHGHRELPVDTPVGDLELEDLV